ncbi:glycoside hydrolase family 3 protein [Erythrobacter sp. EC-HK427]|uniref:glycoside hydrolase family 3 protein n=1 Tax=Erythrobacter sp. EC-HK427 TaxID=2038396 RepID=UPI001252F194|nr:glycoside hydrolase family 3 protein [Erythrobacter sp. EC-HK427]VVT01283.1 1,4-beta-D-glucan glucohydrolase [Erythrobacter sp. EC-HK427]
MRYRVLISALPFFALAGCATVPEEVVSVAPDPIAITTSSATPGPGIANPEIWPEYEYPVPVVAEHEARIDALLASMTLEEKIGQLIQADLCCVTPDEVRQYNLGSILVGGNSGPNGNDFSPAPDWLAAADAFYNASVDRSDGGVGIPVVWGTDAVHGHSNIIGATIFPHNIGLGAAHNPALIEQIGQVTAREIRVTGQEWTFAPTVAVPQDFRWGRAYEGYSSDPDLVASYVGALLQGLQGDPDNMDLLSGPYVIASTKHFLADGGTDNGVDQGDSSISEEDLRDIHGVPYGPAVEGGVATVMASFSSWQGVKMTGNYSLLTEVLNERMGFGGFIVSDWNAHGQVAGCTNESCPQALLAGIDMYMAPDTWRDVYNDLLARAQSGELPMERIDSAVERILRVKLRLGLFDHGAPSTRPLAGEYELLGSAEHRAVARDAVRQSLVLLKNQSTLPIAAGGHLLVTGDGFDDVGRQSGGWTITWQGTGLNNEDHFPGATSLWDGFREAMEAGGGSAEMSADGSFGQRPDVAVVVFGETPYAEFQGDRATLQLDQNLTGPWQTMRDLQAQGIPVVALMITGRPLYVNPALNASDAFVVAWLPGSEGGGVADVLVGDAAGNPRYPFTGRLPTAWPLTARMEYGALFEFGEGLTYETPDTAWTPLPEETGVAAGGDERTWFLAGVPAASWSLHVTDPAQPSSQTRITTVPAEILGGRVEITAVNHVVQEGARQFTLSGDTTTHITVGIQEAVDLSRETNADILLLFTMNVGDLPENAVIGMRDVTGNLATSAFNVTEGQGFVRYGIPLKCFRDKGADMTRIPTPFLFGGTGAGEVALAEVRLGMDAEVILPCD